jgi:hypothetical protein
MEHCHLPLRPLSADSSIPQRQRHEGRGMIRSILLICTLALATCDPERENGLVVRSAPYLRARGSVA